MNPKTNIASLERNTRVKLIASLKASLTRLSAELETEISRLNSDSQRPIYRVNDLAGEKVGKAYLLAPESHSGDRAWAIQLGQLYQDTKRLERRILRTEYMAKGNVNHE